jgi:acetyltransferase-like isoleucine patch superfamily enzyme
VNFLLNSIFHKSLNQRLHKKVIRLVHSLREEKRSSFNRHVPIGELLSDRVETAQFMGFGEGTTCYNSALIIGDVRIGNNCWIGPNVVLDGSGGLVVGNWVTISAGSQIYSHTSIERSLSKGTESLAYSPVHIADGCYLGPNTIIAMGVSIGESAIIGAGSFVNKDVKAGTKVFGIPAREVPE